MTKKDDTIFIIHILDCIRNIEEYSKGLDEKSFLKNIMIHLRIAASAYIREGVHQTPAIFTHII